MLAAASTCRSTCVDLLTPAINLQSYGSHDRGIRLLKRIDSTRVRALGVFLDYGSATDCPRLLFHDLLVDIASDEERIFAVEKILAVFFMRFDGAK